MAEDVLPLRWELLAQLILTATLLPGRLWPRMQLPSAFSSEPLLI